MTIEHAPEPAADVASLDRSTVRVGIIDDHGLISDTLSLVLNDRGFVAFGLRPTSFDEALAFVDDNGIDFVLIDLNLGELGLSLPLIASLREKRRRVAVFTGDPSKPNWGAAIEAGASTVISKADTFTELLDRVVALLDDVVEQANVERYELLESLRSHREEERRRLAPFELLTVREQEVLHALMLGMSAEEISSTMFVSMATTRTHIRSILLKLEVKSQLAAVALAVAAGWQAPAQA